MKHKGKQPGFIFILSIVTLLQFFPSEKLTQGTEGVCSTLSNNTQIPSDRLASALFLYFAEAKYRVKSSIFAVFSKLAEFDGNFFFFHFDS